MRRLVIRVAIWNGGNPLFVRGARHRGQPVVLSEVGGFLMTPSASPGAPRDRQYALYDAYTGPEDLAAKSADLMDGLAPLPFVAGSCHTQLTDIEQEVNGLLTYDRRPKLDRARLAAIHRRLRAGW